MRSLLLFITIVVIYYALKTVVRSALRSYSQEGTRTRIRGEEMISCPECRTYVVKDRAVTRRTGKTVHSFCSEACAGRFEEKQRD